MCGIGGLIYTPGTQPCSESVLERMAQALGHRGPNGVHIARLGRADMVHTRLAIIDLEGGDQPLTSGDGTLVANGEIYNDPQIRRQIGPEHFQTGSDCESPCFCGSVTAAPIPAGCAACMPLACTIKPSRNSCSRAIRLGSNLFILPNFQAALPLHPNPRL